MSCRKVSRALLERFRFGELDAACDEYLEHLERCSDCQREVAVDRELARELRRTLRIRVEGFEPSPAVWRAVRLQAADPEPPTPWWPRLILGVGRRMAVMVPVASMLLAAVLAVGSPPTDIDTSATARVLASEMQWQVQLAETATAEVRVRPEFHPTPSQPLPRPSGDWPYAEVPLSLKLYTEVPNSGVIR
jgi:anti-sigma factor RsiW